MFKSRRWYRGRLWYVDDGRTRGRGGRAVGSYRDELRWRSRRKRKRGRALDKERIDGSWPEDGTRGDVKVGEFALVSLIIISAKDKLTSLITYSKPNTDLANIEIGCEVRPRVSILLSSTEEQNNQVNMFFSFLFLPLGLFCS